METYSPPSRDSVFAYRKSARKSTGFSPSPHAYHLNLAYLPLQLSIAIHQAIKFAWDIYRTRASSMYGMFIAPGHVPAYGIIRIVPGYAPVYGIICIAPGYRICIRYVSHLAIYQHIESSSHAMHQHMESPSHLAMHQHMNHMHRTWPYTSI